ncbi:dTDP-4-dehydrorhamnose reductase [Pseudorhodobacter sp.]|uniref:dTDP-4-dehydrorhamnose reductase n=1 Tax=Pseudorhodobacter sp. TaxID=1934400 RepID=UPI002647178D|nr:dTDP-4-dehydrorhamnose reductase [Pseudorhodobacter sp.]MDN5788929.1 dTDP-4-dehydrorhamnose reductase [Pseudorhodobacter sp.]
MKLLVFGQTGQLARELVRQCPAGVVLETLSRADADLTDPSACAAFVAGSDADAVINAAAYTAVDKAESDEATALMANGTAPTAMARAAAAKGIPFLHVSTDYVFDGNGEQPFAPDHATAPLGAYGRSKLAGEIGIRAANGPHVILRTSWVVSAHGANFVKTMLRLGAERKELNVVADQIGAPSPAADLAQALHGIATAMIAGAHSGTYHYAGMPETSWAGFAREIMARAGLDCVVHDIATTAYPTPARRPLNSRLDCATLTRDFGIARPDWRQGLQAILDELKGTA